MIAKNVATFKVLKPDVAGSSSDDAFKNLILAIDFGKTKLHINYPGRVVAQPRQKEDDEGFDDVPHLGFNIRDNNRGHVPEERGFTNEKQARDENASETELVEKQ
jgi:hypothetical protein